MNSLTQTVSAHHSLVIYSKTWTRDSHGLFDFESEQVNSSVFAPVQDGLMIRNEKTHEVKLINGKVFDAKENEDEKILATILFEGEVSVSLPVNNNTLSDLQEKIWYVMKPNVSSSKCGYLSNYVYALKKNDILKLGRIKFVVRDLNIVNGQYESSVETFKPYYEHENSQIVVGELCRYCLIAAFDDSNPMISICKCKGTMNLHLNCLKIWLEQKSTVKELTSKPGISYTIKSFNCEICKGPYPTTIKYNDQFLHLLNYTIPEGQNYVILESLNSVKENAYPLSIHVLMFIENESSFILGRGHEADIRISDISVSRAHARIFMKDNKFYMEDMGSKFGTLVLAKDNVQISQLYGQQVGSSNTTSYTLLQVGRTLLYFEKYKAKKVQKINEDYAPNNLFLTSETQFGLNEEGNCLINQLILSGNFNQVNLNGDGEEEKMDENGNENDNDEPNTNNKKDRKK